MRMSPERLRLEIKAVRHATGMSQERFVAVYGRQIHVSHDSVLSRLESGDRPISVKVLSGYVDALPEKSAAIERHLKWLTPVVKEDIRSTHIQRLPDGSFSVSEDVKSTVDLNYYLFCHCRGREVEQQLRRRVPSLYGIRVWPTEIDLASAVRQLSAAPPLTCFIEGASQQQVEVDLQPLSLTEVAELGGDLDGVDREDVLFYGKSLEDYPGDKVFVMDSVEARRSTLREWQWIATFPYRQLVHKIRMTVADGQDVGGFNVHSFMPDAVVARHNTSTSLTVTLRTGTPLQAGHGWIATWTNPPA